MNCLPSEVRALAARYKTHRSAVTNTPETHNLASLSQRLLLSPEDVLQVVSAGSLLPLAGPTNGKFAFASSVLDEMRNRVVDFVARSTVENLSRGDADPERMACMVQRAFERQMDLARGSEENLISFAQDDDDDFLDRAKKAAAAGVGIGAAGLAGYGAYRYLRNRGNGGGALPGGFKPQLPPGPDYSGDAMNPKHPAPAGGALTTASPTSEPKYVGKNIIDPLTTAIAKGKKAIAQRGSAIWQALRSIPLE